jgi:hypothetical protein
MARIKHYDEDGIPVIPNEDVETLLSKPTLKEILDISKKVLETKILTCSMADRIQVGYENILFSVKKMHENGKELKTADDITLSVIENIFRKINQLNGIIYAIIIKKPYDIKSEQIFDKDGIDYYHTRYELDIAENEIDKPWDFEQQFNAGLYNIEDEIYGLRGDHIDICCTVC